MHTASKTKLVAPRGCMKWRGTLSTSVAFLLAAVRPTYLRHLRVRKQSQGCETGRVAPRLAFQVLDRQEFGYQAASLSALLRLATLCRRPRQFDVLHAHFGPVGNSFRFARELWDAPLIVSFHGYDFSTVPRKEGARVYQKLFATADAVTVNSDYTRRQVETLGCPAARLHKLPVGLDPDAFPFRERALKPGEPVRILTVARLTEIKGHAFVVRAVAKLRELRAEVRYRCARNWSNWSRSWACGTP